MLRKIKNLLLVTAMFFSLSVYAEDLTPELCKSKVEEGATLIQQEGEAALAKIKDEKGSFRFADGAGYLWIQDMDGMMIMHPIKPTLDGKPLLNMKDENGVYLFVEFNNICESNGSGWVQYSWPKPGATASSPKVSYVKLVKFADKQWVVGCGMYDVTAKDIRVKFPGDAVFGPE